MSVYYFAGHRAEHGQRFAIVDWSERQDTFLARVFERQYDNYEYQNPDLSVAFFGFQDSLGNGHTPGPRLKTLDDLKKALEPYAELPPAVAERLERDRQLADLDALTPRLEDGLKAIAYIDTTVGDPYGIRLRTGELSWKDLADKQIQIGRGVLDDWAMIEGATGSYQKLEDRGFAALQRIVNPEPDDRNRDTRSWKEFVTDSARIAENALADLDSLSMEKDLFANLSDAFRFSEGGSAISGAFGEGASLDRHLFLYRNSRVSGERMVEVFSFAGLPGTYVIDDDSLYHTGEKFDDVRASLLFNYQVELMPMTEIKGRSAAEAELKPEGQDLEFAELSEAGIGLKPEGREIEFTEDGRSYTVENESGRSAVIEWREYYGKHRLQGGGLEVEVWEEGAPLWVGYGFEPFNWGRSPREESPDERLRTVTGLKAALAEHDLELPNSLAERLFENRIERERELSREEIATAEISHSSVTPDSEIARGLLDAEANAAAELGIEMPKLDHIPERERMREYLEAPLVNIVESYQSGRWPGSASRTVERAVNEARLATFDIDTRQMPEAYRNRLRALDKIIEVGVGESRLSWNERATKIAGIAHQGLGLGIDDDLREDILRIDNQEIAEDDLAMTGAERIPPSPVDTFPNLWAYEAAVEAMEENGIAEVEARLAREGSERARDPRVEAPALEDNRRATDHLAYDLISALEKAQTEGASPALANEAIEKYRLKTAIIDTLNANHPYAHEVEALARRLSQFGEAKVKNAIEELAGADVLKLTEVLTLRVENSAATGNEEKMAVLSLPHNQSIAVSSEGHDLLLKELLAIDATYRTGITPTPQAIHHFDAPWAPARPEQSEGRGRRREGAGAMDSSRELLTGGLISALEKIADLRSKDFEGIKPWSYLYHESVNIAADAVNSYAVKTSILDALRDGKQHSTVEIVKPLTGSGAFEKEEVHRAFLELADSYVIAPQRHDHPGNPVHGDISLMPQNAEGRYYIGASLRSGLELPPVPDRDKTLVEALQNITRIEALTPDGYSWKDRVLKTEEIANGALDSDRNRNEMVSLARILEEAERLKEGIGRNDQAQAQSQDTAKAQSVDTDDEGHSFSV